MLEKNCKDKWIDAHTHMNKRAMKEEDILMVCNVSSKEEYENYIQWKQTRENDYYTVGIHPWSSDTKNIDEILHYINNALWIGEIGMDSVWCNVDIEIQERVFIKQLKIASELNKPVILHTKGMEKRIAEIIKENPNTYIVHWFASYKDLVLYKDLDCYFTIGPAVLVEEEIQQISKHINLDRLLIETDGVEAMEWLLGKKLSSKEYHNLLIETYIYLSKIYEITVEELKDKVQENFDRINR